MERDAEIYWIAGFLEGEGCFGWYGEKRRIASRKKHLGYPLVAAGQNDPEPLERIARTFPGTVRTVTRETKTGNTHWEYRVINEPAIDVMVAVFPLMTVRRQEAIKETVARYAERAAERLQDAMFCSKGHPRDRFGARRTMGVGEGHLYCRECNRIYAAEKTARKQAAAMESA